MTTQTYSAEQFRKMADKFKQPQEVMIRAALRIAAKVMDDDVVIRAFISACDPEVVTAEGAAKVIRATLTQDERT